MKRRRLLLLAWLGAACRPSFDENDSLISSATVLAVQAEPPEAKPGTSATYRALVAQPIGSDDVTPVFRWCTAPLPEVENDAVSSACFDASSLTVAGTGLVIAAPTPTTACALFGPDTPPGGFRPRDPDATGGYYAPLRVDVPRADPSFYLARILCNLAQADPSVAADYAGRYVPNQNPRLLPLTVSLAAIQLGARIELAASWTPESAESYLSYDRAAQALVTRKEALSVAWYATGGSFDTESTGVDGDDPVSSSSNAWTAPSAPGPARIWIVLRDSRGGADFARYDVVVGP
ncbi:MAG TPA: hypothetical protein VGI10_24360 [Polyangiaceae bacterium]|jgi:hypothetical protein